MHGRAWCRPLNGPRSFRHPAQRTSAASSPDAHEATVCITFFLYLDMGWLRRSRITRRSSSSNRKARRMPVASDVSGQRWSTSGWRSKDGEEVRGHGPGMTPTPDHALHELASVALDGHSDGTPVLVLIEGVVSFRITSRPAMSQHMYSRT